MASNKPKPDTKTKTAKAQAPKSTPSPKPVKKPVSLAKSNEFRKRMNDMAKKMNNPNGFYYN